METNRERWLRRMDPVGIADAANRGFVRLARSLLRLVSLRNPFEHRRASQDVGRRPRRSPPSAPAADLPGRRIDRPDTPERGSSATSPAARPGAMGGGEPSGEQQRVLRALFLDDADRRLAAVRWLRKRGSPAALVTLQSVLAIEEDDGVRDEIARTVDRLKRLRSSGQGGGECSSS